MAQLVKRGMFISGKYNLIRFLPVELGVMDD